MLKTEWKPATPEVEKFLDNECREPHKLVLNEHCILKLTINMEELSQGKPCILAQPPNASENSVLVYVAPDKEAIAQEHLFRDRLLAPSASPKSHWFHSNYGQLLCAASAITSCKLCVYDVP